jgi:hypothetical protein
MKTRKHVYLMSEKEVRSFFVVQTFIWRNINYVMEIEKLCNK